ncbi:hypothetical protein ATG_04960 [Desulfurococcaceae archaeon AG1]|nr:hypothetical protein ATG_04960 [Desulfurococcaceae archaeon AG1]
MDQQSSSRGIIGEFLKKLLDKKYCEIYVSHDIDSVIAASIIIRLMGAHKIDVGVSSASTLLTTTPPDTSLIIGSKPPRGGGGLAILRRRDEGPKIGEWIIIYASGSISQEVLEAVSQFYQVPRELRGAAVAGHMASFSKNLLSSVDDKIISGLGEVFGSDSSHIKEGLKVMGFGVWDSLSYVFENTLDPYIPGVTGNPSKVSEIVGSIQQSDKEALKRLSKAINDLTGLELVSVGLKPIYWDEYPFVDPYELHICLLASIASGSPEVSSYISTGMPGLSRIAYRCLDHKKMIIDYLKDIIDKSKRVSTYSVKGRVVTIYPRISVNIIWPVHRILALLSHYNGYAVYEIEEGYAIPVDKTIDPVSMKGLRITPGGLAIVESVQGAAEVVSLLQ